MPGRFGTEKHHPEEDLPKDLADALEEAEADFDDREPTQVTKLMDGLKECVAETQSSLKHVAEEADRVNRLTRRNSKSYPKLRAVLSKYPPPGVSKE